MMDKKRFFQFVIMCFFLIPLLTVGLVTVAYGEELTGEEIMNRVDENLFLASARMESELIIHDRGREMKKTMISYIRTENDVTEALVEFTNPRDRGVKYLLEDDQLWMYFPDAEDLVHISGHMLEEGMMGSDFSYQDLLESEKITELYNFEKEGRDLLNDREVFIIDAIAREDKDPAYYQRKFWVDSERFVILREEMYARGGRLLKVMENREIEEVKEGRFFPLKMVMEDKLKEDTKTVHRIIELELDYDILEGKISLDQLQ